MTRLGLLLLALAAPLSGADPPVDFGRDVLPILSDNCFFCHGPDAKARKAQLRFDTKEGAFRVRDGEAVIVPGKSGESELMRRLTAADADERMPPPKSNRHLTAKQIDTLKRWIDQGAKWGQPWAFNRNQRFDEFITWQLAGDLLPNATKEQRLATAFNRLHMQNEEGGIVEEEFRVAYVVDRVTTFGTAFLGLTLECSRCHDHKYDPIKQKDFYSLFAFFQNIDEP